MSEAAAATRVPREREGDSPVRHALRRLSVYLRRNVRFYLLWFLVVLLFVASFNMVPLAVGWAIDGVVDG